MSKTVDYLYRLQTPNSTFAHTIYSRVKHQTSLGFNEYWWATPAKRELLKKSMERCVETGFHKIATFRGVVAHEYGHVLDIAHKVSSTPEVMLYLRETDKITIKNIFGDYANQDPGEFVAEAFCNYEAKNLPKENMDFVDGIIKKYVLK